MEEGFTIVDQNRQWKKVLPLWTSPTNGRRFYHCRPVSPMEEGFTIVDQSHQWKKVLPL